MAAKHKKRTRTEILVNRSIATDRLEKLYAIQKTEKKQTFSLPKIARGTELLHALLQRG